MNHILHFKMSQLTEEEKKAVLNQVPIVYTTPRGRIKGTSNTRAVVCVPPRAEGENERWVGVYQLSRNIDINIEQPNQNRTVMQANEGSCYGITYYYFDQLTCCIIGTIIATIICCILTSPLVLLCCIPMIKKMIQVIQLLYRCCSIWHHTAKYESSSKSSCYHAVLFVICIINLYAWHCVRVAFG